MLDVLLAREMLNQFKELQLEGNKKSIPSIQAYFHSCLEEYSKDIKGLACLCYALIEMRKISIAIKSTGQSKLFANLRLELSEYVFERDERGNGTHFTNAEQAVYQRDLEQLNNKSSPSCEGWGTSFDGTWIINHSMFSGLPRPTKASITSASIFV